MINRIMLTGNDLYHTECVVRGRGKLIPIEVDGMVVGLKCECGVRFVIQEVDNKSWIPILDIATKKGDIPWKDKIVEKQSSHRNDNMLVD